MFRDDARRLREKPAEGAEVFVFARPGVWEEKGEFRLTVTQMLATAALGSGQAELERVKALLEKEGLFDQARKRPLPALAGRIAVVTSTDGAALRDIIIVARKRWPAVRLLVLGTRVQGDTAEAELVRALRLVNRLAVEVCIVGRGGGGREDLAAFNREAVCRALAAVRVPDRFRGGARDRRDALRFHRGRARRNAVGGGRNGRGRPPGARPPGGRPFHPAGRRADPPYPGGVGAVVPHDRPDPVRHPAGGGAPSASERPAGRPARCVEPAAGPRSGIQRGPGPLGPGPEPPGRLPARRSLHSPGTGRPGSRPGGAA